MLVIMTLVLTGTILAAAGVWNPLPQIEAWWHQLTKLSEPEPTWTARAGGNPDVTAIMTGGQVVVASYGTVTAYRETTGEVIWSYPAYWALPAGDVVVIRSKPENRNQANNAGYTVLDPATGQTMWSNQDAKAVWAFTDQLVELVCPDAGDCTLRGRRHLAPGAELWRVTLPATARVLKDAGPGVVGLADPAEGFAKSAPAPLAAAPALFAIRVDRTIHIVDTAPPGARVREVTSDDQQTRLTFAGERVLLARSAPADSGCRYTIEGRTSDTDRSDWNRTGLDLGTGSGTVCDQREDPAGAGGRILALNSQGQPVLINASDGEISWTGVPGEGLLATDGDIGVVLGADRRTIRVVDMLAPGGRPSFTATFGLEPTAAITPDYVVIRDSDQGRVVVLSHFAGLAGNLRVVADVKTRSLVAAIGPRGLLLSNGRTVGYLPLGG